MLDEPLRLEREYLAGRFDPFADSLIPEWLGWNNPHDARLKVLNALAAALEAVTRLEDHDAPRRVEQWHEFARDLGLLFRAVMRRANPELELGLSNDGPIGRFVAAVIPFITGETPSVESVARHLQRQEVNIRRGDRKPPTRWGE